MHKELVWGHINFVEANKLDVHNKGTQTLLVASYILFHEDDHVERTFLCPFDQPPNYEFGSKNKNKSNGCNLHDKRENIIIMDRPKTWEYILVTSHAL
jgi:hypothetical protein